MFQVHLSAHLKTSVMASEEGGLQGASCCSVLCLAETLSSAEFDVQTLLNSLRLCMCVKSNWIINQGCDRLVPSCCWSTFVNLC